MSIPNPPLGSSQTDKETGRTSAVWASWYARLQELINNLTTDFGPSSATYITQTPNTSLTAEQPLSTLASGYMKSTTATGVVSTTSTVPTTDLSGTITNAQLAGSITASKLVGTDIATVGTITSGTWNGTSISTTYTDAKLKTLTGTANRVTIGGTATDPTVDVSTSYIGQATITTLGTITTGTWTATKLAEGYGGTNQSTYTLGDILYSSASNTLSKLTGNTTTTKKFLTQTGDGAASAAPGWNTIVAGDLSPSGAALTKVDDTNVTLTLGGTPTTALITAASITAGWTGQLSLARGGTASNLTASNGGIVYSDASALQILAGTATASKMLLSASNTTPTWSTSTIPTSAGATANKVLLSDGTNYVLSTPTFPNASATSRKIIVSDGTNWIASTETYAVPSTSGKIMQSDGTNWTSATPTGTGTPVLATSPTLVTPLLGTPTSGVLTNCTGLTEAGQTLADNTTNDVSTSKHGYVPKAPNDTSKFLRGDGTWNAPSGSGTVNSGTAGQIAYYAANGTAVSGGQLDDILGTATNDNASTGYCGEFVSSVIASGSAASIATTTATNLTSISLTAGDWDVWGNITMIPTVGASAVYSWISSTSATIPDSSVYTALGASSAIFGTTSSTPPQLRFSLSGTTTIYLTGFVVFAAGTCTMDGGIYARRRR